MNQEGMDAFLVPRADEFLGEYVPPSAERLKFLTGFTGSAGIAVIYADKAFLFTDGRYTQQARMECDKALFEVMDITQTETIDFLAKNGGTVGYDPWLHTFSQISKLEEKKIPLKAVPSNLVDAIWTERPAKPSGKSFDFPDKIAGRTAQEKIDLVSTAIKDAGADAMIITMPDSVCWLLNKRGHDIDYTPLVLTYALVQDGKAEMIAPSFDFTKLTGKTIALDFKRAPLAVKMQLEKIAKVIDLKDPCIDPKARKTPSEQQSIRAVHVKDGVAVVKFLYWFDQGHKNLTELGVVDKLESFRREDKTYKEPSFPTIAGFNANGAIIHYRVTEKTNLDIKGDGLLLLDSGAQYEWGTTDITRTIRFGNPNDEMKERFTLVLKGHIALAMAKFKPGTLGKEIDLLARQPLLDKNLNYAHGTGHGVGCYLSVHEEAAGISPRGEAPLEAGMLLSNEPGYYQEGAYGIRTESLVLIQEEGADLKFETITLAPIDTSLIKPGMLGAEETQWLNDYHACIYKTLAPHLTAEVKNWLQDKTKPL